VRLSRNAKGDTQIEVVVGAGEEGIESAAACAERAVEVYDSLRERYPLGEPPAGEEVS
jgi:NADH dehydrogenase FAD-containing subunit